MNDAGVHNGTWISDDAYLKKTLATRNCEFYKLKDLHVAIIATKDIKKNDELFLSYGSHYWTDLKNKS